METELKELTIIVKWCGKEYPVSELTAEDTVAMLRHEICKRTQVRPERQKLLNLKYKGIHLGPAQRVFTSDGNQFGVEILMLSFFVHLSDECRIKRWRRD